MEKHGQRKGPLLQMYRKFHEAIFISYEIMASLVVKKTSFWGVMI